MNHMVIPGDVDNNREDDIGDKAHETQDQANPQFATEQLTQMFNIWSDISRLPTVGPLFAYSQSSRSDLQDIIDLWKTFLEFQIHLKEFWARINNAYTHALAKASAKAPKEYSSKKDFENFRKILIDIFEEEFTGLFDSKDYAVLNGILLRDQYEAVMHLQKLTEKQFKVLNLPTRSELDHMSKDIHDLKKTVHDLNKNFHDLARRSGALRQNESGDISK